MCGICGYVSRSGEPDPALVLRMMGRLAHRGPDGSGYYRDEQAALGHTRLAIIDAAGGVQPLSNEDGRVWITFNGEIFNYVELAAELKALGHRFKTASDTEVVIHAWEQWGSGCFPRFNGQWAIALWDRDRGELVLSRDPAGILPLYYCHTPRRFLFASEMKAIFADGAVPRSFDPQGLAEVFSFWCAVAPRTPYAGVRELEPGHWAILRRDGSLEKSAYWRASFPPEGEEASQDMAENGRRLREKLIEATRLRFLRSDVPVGAYLSGGIDSSVTAAIIAKYTGAPLRTFSLRFSDAEFDEGPYQEEMARRLGTEHLSVEVSAADIAEAFPKAIWHGEKPILRAAPAPLFLLSRLVRGSGYKVVVTGEGSDEVLAGYDIFREARVRAFLARDPDSEKRARSVELLYPWLLRAPGKAPSFARAFFGKDLALSDPALSHRPRWDSAAAIRLMLDPALKAAVESGRPDEELLARMPAGREKWDPRLPGPMARVHDPPAGLHPFRPRGPDAHGQFGGRPLPLPGQRSDGPRELLPLPSQAHGARREASVEARVRRSRPGIHPTTAEAAVPLPRRVLLLLGPPARMAGGARLGAGHPRGRRLLRPRGGLTLRQVRGGRG